MPVHNYQYKLVITKYLLNVYGVETDFKVMIETFMSLEEADIAFDLINKENSMSATKLY